MAYQPLYATVTDCNGTRGTHSLRNRVEWVNIWVNSHFGDVLRADISSTGSLDKKDTYEAEQKIKEWQKKGNSKKVKQWKQKLKERQEFNKEQEAKESVIVNINIEENPKFNVSINGIHFKPADLKLLQQARVKNFLGELSVASAFALIPDIKRVIDNPTKENVKAFKEKRDRIGNFLKEEEKKLVL